MRAAAMPPVFAFRANTENSFRNERSSRWGWDFARGRIGFRSCQLGFEFLQLCCRQIWREVLDAGENLDRFEVVLGAPRMDGARGHEAPFLEENELYPPTALVDGRVARTTMSPTARSALGSVDSRYSPVGDPEAGGRDQPIRVLERLASSFDRGQEGLGPLVRAADQVKPVQGFAAAVAEGIGQGIAEPKLARFDLLPTTAALGAGGRSRLDDMWHSNPDSTTVGVGSREPRAR